MSYYDFIGGASYSEVETLIKSGFDINKKDSEGRTLLHVASMIGRLKVVELLLSNGADINARDNDGCTPLYSACIRDFNNYDVVKYLIDDGALVNSKTDDNSTPLHAAAASWDYRAVELLIKKGADVNAVTKSGNTPLYLAVEDFGQKKTIDEKKKMIKILVDSGADPMCRVNSFTPIEEALSSQDTEIADYLIKMIKINAKDSSGDIPIHHAIRANNLEMVKLLIENGADINIKDDVNYTPLHVARLIKGEVEDQEIIKLLEEKGAIDEGKEEKIIECPGPTEEEVLKRVKEMIASGKDINLKDEYGSTELHMAALRGHINVVKLLIENHADLNLYDENGFMPLHCALFKSDYQIAKLLIENGADVNAKNRQTGDAPLNDLISREGKDVLSIIKYLLDKGADINSHDDHGDTPLHRAVRIEDVNIVELLIKKKPNLNIPDKTGDTPLITAVRLNNVAITKLLIKAKADLNIPGGIVGDTPLHVACMEKNKEIVEALVNNGAAINPRDINGLTPLYFVYPSRASEPNEAAIADILIKHGGKTFGIERMIK
jgi:ankyrin repeat protein